VRIPPLKRIRIEEPTLVTLHHRPAGHDRVAPSDAPETLSPECQKVLANFWDYLDGNCSSELAERIEEHVSSCMTCWRFRRFQEQFLASLAEVRKWSPAPRHLHDRVREALAAERRENRRRE
jgi:anti-sigma factor (TIGR02949 family)